MNSIDPVVKYLPVTFAKLVKRLATTALSALLFVMSYPTYSFSFLAWFALVPLILVCMRSGPKASFLYGFLFGFLVAHGIFQWMYHLENIKVYHCLLLASFVALYPALWCVSLSLLKEFAIPELIAIPSCWVVLHFLKANLGFLAMPWASLAHSQSDFLPVLQIVSLTGEYGLTFLIVLINTALAHCLVTRKLINIAFAGMIFLGVYLWGAWYLAHVETGSTVTVAAVQPSSLATRFPVWDENYYRLDVLMPLTLSAAASNPDLIVWPESQLRRWKGDPELAARLKSIVVKTGVPLVFGVTDLAKFYNKQVTGQTGLASELHNSAFYIDHEGVILGPYNKHILLPFVEYTPLEGIIQWPEWLVKKSAGLTPGKRKIVFQLTPDIVVVSIICWENLFPDYVRSVIGGFPSIVVQLVNDSDFGKSSAPFQHNLASVLRAVENHTPVVISSNTGPSRIIDAHGRVVAEFSELFEAGVVTGSVTSGEGRTFYNRYGDIFVLIVSLYLLFYTLYRVRKNS